MESPVLNYTRNAVERPSRPFQQVVRLRKACRKFKPTPVSNETILSVLDDAQQSPSNCNTQPWSTHVVSGEKVKALSAAILQAYEKEEFTPDFSFDVNHFYGRYGARQQEQGKAYYESMGVAREDKAGRKAALEFAYQFFGAPHVAFLFLPSFGDHVRVVADVGLYGQTLLLSLVDHGLAGIPMTSLGYFADIIRKVLGISEEFKLLFGIPFGYADEEAPGASFKLGRDPLFSNVVFHQ